MPKKKSKVELELFNNTGLLLFVCCYYRSLGKLGRVAVLYVFDRPPDSPSYNNEHLMRVEPMTYYTWDISLTTNWRLRNRTRYEPLQHDKSYLERKGVKKHKIIILPTNNHISLDDKAILAAHRAQANQR